MKTNRNFLNYANGNLSRPKIIAFHITQNLSSYNIKFVNPELLIIEHIHFGKYKKTSWHVHYGPVFFQNICKCEKFRISSESGILTVTS